MWTNDHELFRLLRTRLFTAVVGDVLDGMGYRHQFLPPEIRPLRDDMVVVGRALTVLEADIVGAPVTGKPFGVMLEALDDLKPNEVYVATGASPSYALWGELMSTRAMHLQAAGAVLNGYSRDTHGILRLGFPTFSMGPYAQDQGPRGEVVDYRVPVQIGQVGVAPGDIVFGDIDGVLIVPKAAEREALTLALEKVSKENLVREAIENGMPTVEAFARFGVM
jgi:4-hydroxy-4-methyl-2-oxoglutarate aldolase